MKSNKETLDTTSGEQTEMQMFVRKLVVRPLSTLSVRRLGHFRQFTTVQESSLTLKGSCVCGASSWTATGCSQTSFICHCSNCRNSSKLPYLPAVAFSPDQVTWSNPSNLRSTLLPNSSSPRLYCNECSTYLAEDATTPLGVVALALPIDNITSNHDQSSICNHNNTTISHTTTSSSIDQISNHSIPEAHLPQYHIFYAERIDDVNDSLPKWDTFPQGVPSPNTSTSTSTKTIPHKYTPPKDVLPLSPTRPPHALCYQFPEKDPIPNHTTKVTTESIKQRIKHKYLPSPSSFVAPSRQKRQVIIVGGGHNGLVTAAYLAKKDVDVLVLERRDVIGGAAVSEEIFPGYKFSRASYLAGLLRPQVIQDLQLEKYGFKYISRDPSSFTPTKELGKYLLLQQDDEKTRQSIAQFSEKDASAFPQYEDFLSQVREIVSPLLDAPPPDPLSASVSWRERASSLSLLAKLSSLAIRHKGALVPLYELFTAPAAHLLDRWFESEILKTTLATDAVIGAMAAPSTPTSAYVLLHHVMGEADGRKGVWAYIEGGMGSVSNAIAQSAKDSGAEISLNAAVNEIIYERVNGGGDAVKATGVRMYDGTVLHADVVVSNATPYHTFLELLPGFERGEQAVLPEEFSRHVRFTDYSCGAFKINLAIDRLPNFICSPTPKDCNEAQPHHRGTIHFENSMQELEDAYREASMGIPATRPVIEMTIPSSLDHTLAPLGKHVCQLFIQFAPYDVDPNVGNWADPIFKQEFANRVYSIIDEFAPGFSDSILHEDVLSPLDLEQVFGLHKGNIFHGALSLHQLGYARPAPGFSSHRTPVENLYLCGAGAHPGSGVMGAAGRNCANIILSDLVSKK